MPVDDFYGGIVPLPLGEHGRAFALKPGETEVRGVSTLGGRLVRLLVSYSPMWPRIPYGRWWGIWWPRSGTCIVGPRPPLRPGSTSSADVVSVRVGSVELLAAPVPVELFSPAAFFAARMSAPLRAGEAVSIRLRGSGCYVAMALIEARHA